MIQFSHTPWAVDLGYSCVEDCAGGNFIEIHAEHLTIEERATILRAIAMLPQIMQLFSLHLEEIRFTRKLVESAQFNWNPDSLRIAELLEQIVAYILPIEGTAEVLTNRWLHAQQQLATSPAAETALQNLTTSLAHSLNGDMSRYPVNVQDAFAQAMALLNLSKHMKHEPEAY